MKTAFYVLQRLIIACLCFFFLSASLSAEQKIHILQKGETLYTLGKKYDIPVEHIVKANDIKDPSKLKAGQKIIIPLGSYYNVKKGDTFYSIARAHHVSIGDILSANKLPDNFILKIGDRLFIPAGENAASSSGSAPAAQENAVTELKPLPAEPLTDPRNYVTKKIDNSKIWPVKGTEISYLNGKLYGVLITAGKGADVTSIAAGNIMSSSIMRGFGNVVFVHADNGYIYVYGGLDVVAGKPGDRISFGSRIGSLGIDSRSGKSQVYLMVYKDNKPVDPAKAPRG